MASDENEDKKTDYSELLIPLYYHGLTLVVAMCYHCKQALTFLTGIFISRCMDIPFENDALC